MYKKINILGIICLFLLLLSQITSVLLAKHVSADIIHFYIQPALAFIVIVIWVFIYKEFDKIFKTRMTPLYILSMVSWTIICALMAGLITHVLRTKYNHQQVNIIFIRCVAIAIYLFATIVLTTIQYKFANQFKLMYLQTKSPWLKFFTVAYKISAMLLFLLIGYVLFTITRFIFNFYIVFIRKEPIIITIANHEPKNQD